MQAQHNIQIVPLPAHLQAMEGSFTVDVNTRLVFDDTNTDLRETAEYFSAQINRLSGLNLLKQTGSKQIKLLIGDTLSSSAEGYTLRVTPQRIEIGAAAGTGIFYGLQSLLQTLPAIRTNAPLNIPAMEITDEPRFPWRGFMLDVSRHFFSVETIREMIDLMARFKMNRFHWHLTDDQGWRIEIKAYPKLTGVGAWRQEKEGAQFYEKDTAYLAGKPTYTYGGYYTQEQIKDIVDYARVRGVQIVPEIEMPGHAGAALAAYPQYSCGKTPQEVPNIQASGNFDGFHSNYCPGNPATFTFLENILDEVIGLFPGEYIHIGGDEVDKSEWKQCAACQALMKKEGLKNEEQLQSHFIRRIEDYLISKNRKMIGWGEILEGGLAPEATVMSWIGEKRGIEAAKMKHDVIMCPSDPMYLNRHQTDSFQYEPKAATFSINTLQRVYEYDPVPAALTTAEQQYILGSQALVWTEFIPTVEHLEYMVLPRLCALAEMVWTPKEKQDYRSFQHRLKPQLKAFEQQGIRYFGKTPGL